MIFETYMGSSTDEGQAGVLDKIFQTPSTAKVLDFFIDYKDLDYSLGEIAQKTGLSVQTIDREINHLENLKLVSNERKVGKSSMFRLNSKLKSMILLEDFTLEISQLPSLIEFKKSNNPQKIIEEAIIDKN